jgi:hypothetical protein
MFTSLLSHPVGAFFQHPLTSSSSFSFPVGGEYIHQRHCLCIRQAYKDDKDALNAHVERNVYER